MRLTWDEVKYIRKIDEAAREEGVTMNVCLTIRAPLDVPDAAGKRLIAKKLGHFGQALQRRGQKHIGITVYEKAPHLHAHHLVHVRPGNDDVVARYADGETIHARKADRKGVGYITKQREFLGPDYEKVIQRQGLQWEKSGGPIPGTRWTPTKSAEALLGPAAKSGLAQATNVRGPASITPARFIVGSQSEVSMKIGSEANDAGAPAERAAEGPRDGIGQEPQGGGPACPVEPEQLPLFPVLVAESPRDDAALRHLRQQTGLTQRQIGMMIGIKDRSHIANIERGHDRLSPQRRRLLRYIVETRLAA